MGAGNCPSQLINLMIHIERIHICTSPSKDTFSDLTYFSSQTPENSSVLWMKLKIVFIKPNESLNWLL